MAALNFPSSPSVNDTYVNGGVTYIWDGTTWKSVGAGVNIAESDPVFTASAAGSISGTQVTNWDTAYGWGDHSTQGYLTSYTETGTLQTVTDNGASSNNSITLTNILYLNSELRMGNSAFRIIPNFPSTGTHTIGGVSGLGGIVFRCGQFSSISFTNENGTNTFASISASGGLTAGGLTYPTTNGTLGQVLTSDGAGNVTWGAGGSSLQSRTTASATTSSIADNTSTYITITAAKTYALQKIETDYAAWVTLYTDTTSRANDANRNEFTDPTPGSGVIAEVITSGAVTQKITPGTIGWNDDATPSSDVYLKVVNKSGSTQAITVTLHYVQLEA